MDHLSGNPTYQALERHRAPERFELGLIESEPTLKKQSATEIAASNDEIDCQQKKLNDGCKGCWQISHQVPVLPAAV